MYNKLLKKQGGGCAICGKTPEQEGRNLAVDHDHVSREVRGCLCYRCNHFVIGRNRDFVLFQRAAVYLEHGHTGWFVPEKRPKKRRRRKK